MKKTIKCGIVAAVAVAAGFAAYQSYGSYGAQDSSLLMQNVEALAQNNHPEPGGKDGGEPNGDNGNKPANKVTGWVKVIDKKTGKQEEYKSNVTVYGEKCDWVDKSKESCHIPSHRWIKY